MKVTEEMLIQTRGPEDMDFLFSRLKAGFRISETVVDVVLQQTDSRVRKKALRLLSSSDRSVISEQNILKLVSSEFSLMEIYLDFSQSSRSPRKYSWLV